MIEEEMQVDLLQPWSTFVMKTQLPPWVLEKMIRITDEIVENREGKADNVGAGQMKNQFNIDFKILEQEELMGFLLEICRNYVELAFYQSEPKERETVLKEKWLTKLDGIWINSQKDNEYFPIHSHTFCSISSVMYLKIPEYLPPRKPIGNYKSANPGLRCDDGSIVFPNNVAKNEIWGRSDITISPKVGDFYIFPATQHHQVYPFRTPDGKGERRSVSFNAIFTSKSEQDALRKQQEEQETI